MAVISIISDFGTKDHYVAVLKACLYRRSPSVNLVDITHEISPFDIVQGAFILKSTWCQFPKGTVHIAAINLFFAERNEFIAFEREGHFFVGPNNGIFTLIFDDLYASEIVQVPYDPEENYPLQNALANAACKLSADQDLDMVGTSLLELEKKISVAPVVNESQIRGTVVHIDDYGNVIVNVDKELFERVQKDRDFGIYFKPNDPIREISVEYSDVPIGDVLCFFNSGGYLEVAINKGSAASLLGLKKDEAIQIDFYD
ncbi:SAM hydrolase/SAM-dependent halogenase family protein [Portibacter marinus]|uniref:SAM hydrolase/SAM-dependent halogenase family protein n=1 Tax=Portibacter marinus TaxID=2898660 RepID=UPI001F1D9C61|nr:SAM-dependent chlorinase/fluorinase [Portibacter marinus]